ncbi:MAG: glucose-6-phosphate dehydrogenase [Candidatus Sulfobium sp.]
MIRGREPIDSRFLQTCDIQVEEFNVEPFTMVIFGGAGDLARKKLLPSIMHLFSEKELENGFSVLSFGMPGMDDSSYRELVKDSVLEFDGKLPDEKDWAKFSSHFYYLSGRFQDEKAYESLKEKLYDISVPAGKGKRNIIYYMSVPPQVVPLVVSKLKAHDLCRNSFNTKIIAEKPFGHDRKSAAELNRVLIDAFDENQIYRIDHYLSKEPVQNILFFRFSNFIFEQVWNSNYVDNVQITVAEDIGIEKRGAFYEETGVVRDIVQNHMLQILGLIAMEPPVGFKADFVRDEKTKIFRSIYPFDDDYIDRFTVRGQYGPGRIKGKRVRGYRDEEDVSPSSNQITFFAAKFYIDTLRWAGVPFYVRTGKRLRKRVTEICIQFRQVPLRIMGRSCDVIDPNTLILTVQPDERISLRFDVKYPYSPNQIYPTNMVFSYGDTFRTAFHPPYERLLLDCMRGDLSLFVRQDSVEAMWEIVDPIIRRWEETAPLDFPNYAAGKWGPTKAGLLLKKEKRDWITS